MEQLENLLEALSGLTCKAPKISKAQSKIPRPIQKNIRHQQSYSCDSFILSSVMIWLFLDSKTSQPHFILEVRPPSISDTFEDPERAKQCLYLFRSLKYAVRAYHRKRYHMYWLKNHEKSIHFVGCSVGWFQTSSSSTVTCDYIHADSRNTARPLSFGLLELRSAMPQSFVGW